MLALCQHPGHADLRRRRAEALGHAPHAVEDRDVRAHRLGLEARVRGAEVARRELLAGRQRAGQEAAPEHAEGHEGDAVVGAPRDHVLERLARPQRELALQRAHRVRRVGARAARRRVHSEMPRRRILPSPTSSRERAEALLDRHLGIDAVQVVEVEARRCRGAPATPSHCRRTVSGRPSRTVLRRGKPRFSSPHLEAISDVGRPVAQRAADERLVVAAPVQRRGVEVRDAELDRAPERALGDAIRPAGRGSSPRRCSCSRARRRRRSGRRAPSRRWGSVLTREPYADAVRMSGSMCRTLEGSLRGQFRSHRNSDHRGHHRRCCSARAVCRASPAVRASTCARPRTPSARSRRSSRAACARSIPVTPLKETMTRRRAAQGHRCPRIEDRLDRVARRR